MDLSLSEEQTMLKDSANKFLENEFSMEQVRKYWEDEKGVSPDVWNSMAELGWMGIRIPEEYGGIGLSFLDLAVLFEEMGRVAMPGPFLPTLLVAEAIIDGGNHEQKEVYLEKIAMGEIRATLAVQEEDAGYGPESIKMTASPEGDDFVLNGTKLFVLDGNNSELMVVATKTSGGDSPEEGITLFLVDSDLDGISGQPLKTMDEGRKQSAIQFENVRVTASKVLGEVNKGWDLLRTILSKGALAVSLECVGGGQKALEIAVDYAKERVQFDQVIGSFQAIKHKCAQMMLEVEGARSVAYYAASSMETHNEESLILASAAKSYCADMYRNAATEAIQILGAIGLTEEHELHIYLKRAKMNECLFGDQAFHREELATLLGY